MGIRVVRGKTYGQRLCSELGGQTGEKTQPVLGETPLVKSQFSPKQGCPTELSVVMEMF